jgi:hypothetical protein
VIIYQEQHIIANFATKDFVKTVQLRKHMFTTSTAMMKLPDVNIFTNDGSGPPKDCVVHASGGTLFGGQLFGQVLLVAVLGIEDTVGFNC